MSETGDVDQGEAGLTVRELLEPLGSSKKRPDEVVPVTRAKPKKPDPRKNDQNNIRLGL